MTHYPALVRAPPPRTVESCFLHKCQRRRFSFPLPINIGGRGENLFSDYHTDEGSQRQAAPTALRDQATHQAPPVRWGHTALVEGACQSPATLATTAPKAPVIHSLAQVRPASLRREGLNPSFCTSVNARVQETGAMAKRSYLIIA